MSHLDDFIEELNKRGKPQPESNQRVENTAGIQHISTPHSNLALGTVAERLERERKLNAPEEPIQFTINIFKKEGFVMIGFPGPVRGLRLSKTEAKEFARRIMKECY